MGNQVVGGFTSGAGWANPAQDFEMSNLATCGDNNCAVNCGNNNEIYGFHSNGANIVMGDGSVHLLPKGTDVRIVAALITARGSEPVELPQ